MVTQTAEALREEIISKVSEYHQLTENNKKEFVPGESKITCGGAIFSQEDRLGIVNVAMNMWLTAGPVATQFEKEFANYVGTKYSVLTNSGSSASLLAFSSLTSVNLGDRRILPGDEIITVSAGFPTTISPMVQYGAVPVFIDVNLPDYNIDINKLQEALSPKTKAIIIAHTLGNPFDLQAVSEFCKENNLWLIEDNCDALGATYNNQKTGSWGDLATHSFFPAHHITMGEGGSVCTSNPLLKRNLESFRDWGRDCWCQPGQDNSCNKRFCWKLGDLPENYDHKYTFTHFGYNLKVTEMQAALGLSQMAKVDDFVKARRDNWNYLRKGLDSLSDQLILPEATENSNPSWFGFIITVKPEASFSRSEIIEFLEANNIQTRMLFAGNIVRQPLFNEMRESGTGYRVVGSLDNTDLIMNNAFWIGIHPGITTEMLDYVINKFQEFVK